ncbi:MAG: 3-deoxy-manno-octulosonate cytidylyltransferase [bacterium]|nr:3-deoxy-manno-octulosonate cytidylyltransferase [bacterium]
MSEKANLKIAAIIPARMGATRFPGKPLADILGLPMIEHIRRRVALNENLDQVIVATCDQEIYDVVVANGGECIMTSSAHERCTDRVAEAAVKVDADIIINVQGDEPFVNPDILDDLVKPFYDEPGILSTNLLGRIVSEEEFETVNEVKTVINLAGNVIYFSREPIPSRRKAPAGDFEKLKQLGLIAFTKDFLLKFTALPETPLERLESVDMLRVIEHGYTIRGVITSERTVSVDTPQELDEAIRLMKDDVIKERYM